MLVKRDGSPALPWEAFRILDANNRIEPEQSKQDRFDVVLPASLTGKVTIRANLYLRLVSEAMGQRLGVPIPDPILMTSAETTVSIE